MIAVSILIPDIPESCETQLKRQEHFNANVIDRLVGGGSDVLERFRDEAIKLSKTAVATNVFLSYYLWMGKPSRRSRSSLA